MGAYDDGGMTKAYQSAGLKPPKPPAPIKVTVKKGDTLFGISQKYGLSVDTLKNINGLRSNDIQVGTSLKISIE